MQLFLRKKTSNNNDKKEIKKITNKNKQNFIYLLIFVCPVSVYKLNLHKSQSSEGNFSIGRIYDEKLNYSNLVYRSSNLRY